MQGMSERQYAAHVGLSRGAIQKAKAAGRLVLHEDGSIDAAASDRLRADATDPSKSRKAAAPKLKPVPEAAVSAVGDTLREQGLAAPSTGGGTTFLQAKTAHEVLKAQERRIRLQKLKGEMVDRARAETLVFRLFSTPVPREIGKISYSLYLYHWPLAVVLVYVYVDGPG
ncbi:MAG: hypothetical protein ACK4NE_01560, partial [Albidovulum sp.]